MQSLPTVGIAGAGLLGRLLAWRLAHAGWRVSVFDPAEGAGPVFRSQAPDPYVPTAAGFTAAGMLSPLAELDNAEPGEAALGWRSIELWRDIAANLPQAPYFRAEGSLMLAHRTDLGAAQRVLERLRAATATPEWQRLSPPEGVQALDLPTLRTLEPAIQGPALAWLLPGEAQVDTVAMMAALHDDAPGVDWHWRAPVLAARAGGQGGVLQMGDGRLLAFDRVIDVRAVGAKPELPVRGVRGEVAWLHCPGHGLTRPTRLLHPRHRVYLVPRPGDVLIVGASEIESEDRSPASLRTVVELLAAAHSVVPALAEARILRLDVNLRPALPDNNPRIDHEGALLRINGLFRHGWLLAPALAEKALRDNGWLGSEFTMNCVADSA
ncbi:FAD-dependent oxidoreductase [Ottowia oryzae]|uniref:FAD-dependent oxidoreductase n=1 Tax=Ottowia oryzae TaxID=2109914 RepID=A0A2S0MGK7_9BURK|nr:FAD-dependent oxidoreductase [Ottowia oryzae]AVO34937.1 FAD-dependent oxidoreductase [Ottowia oryzae]